MVAPLPRWLWAPGLALLLACEPKGELDSADTVPEGDSDTVVDTDTLVAWVVRHAEKESEGSDPHLTEEGEARAEALAKLLADVPLVATYATDYNRTRETCGPTSEAQVIDMVDDIEPFEDLALHIIAEHQHEQVLHCGHAWTIPTFMDALGVSDDISIPSGDYGDLWIVTLMGDEVLSVELSHYGE